MSFNFRAAVTVHSDLGAQENEVCHFSIVSPPVCHPQRKDSSFMAPEVHVGMWEEGQE